VTDIVPLYDPPLQNLRSRLAISCMSWMARSTVVREWYIDRV